MTGKIIGAAINFANNKPTITFEMTIFIDGVVSEAKDLGISTETPEELARMKSMWGE